jgi:flagellar FliJ protein
MAFTFRLQALYLWRKNLEELSQLRLAGYLKALAGQEERMEQLRETRKAYDGECRLKAGQGATAGDLILYLDYFDDSFRKLEVLEREREKNLKGIETERRTLMDLTRERKILEKLKERQFKKFLTEQDKKERKLTDDLVVQRRPGSRKGI